jgi:hypothetical protein
MFSEQSNLLGGNSAPKDLNTLMSLTLRHLGSPPFFSDRTIFSAECTMQKNRNLLQCVRFHHRASVTHSEPWSHISMRSQSASDGKAVMPNGLHRFLDNKAGRPMTLVGTRKYGLPSKPPSPCFHSLTSYTCVPMCM